MREASASFEQADPDLAQLVTAWGGLSEPKTALIRRLLTNEVSAETLATIGMLLDADRLRRQAQEGGSR
jgi:hypothetical protein